MVLSHGLRPSLHGALVVVATETVATVTREVTLPRRGNAMLLCDAQKTRVYASNNAGASTTTERLACSAAL